MHFLLFFYFLLALAFGLPTENIFDELIPNSYVVVLHSSVAPQIFVNSVLSNLASRFGGFQQTHTYQFPNFSGFAGTMQQALVAQLMLNDQVQYIEQDRTYQLMARFSRRSTLQQNNSPWGLARISHRSPGSTNYIYDSSAGSGTCVYTLDTGVYAQHSDFGGRATNLASYVSDSNDDVDDNGHGTHVAGIISGSTYGVAKNTLIYAIKIADASGTATMTNIISGINCVVNDAANRKNCPNGKVVNMSFGGSKSSSLNQAVTAAANTGLFGLIAVAAGNDGINVSEDSPSSAPGAFPVGATDNDDNMASWSNYGSTLGVFAPGAAIMSDWIGSTTATNTIDGTSMSSAHVAGLAAYLMSLDGSMSPSAMSSKIKSLATSGDVTGISGASSGTPNIIAYNGI